MQCEEVKVSEVGYQHYQVQYPSEVRCDVLIIGDNEQVEYGSVKESYALGGYLSPTQH